MIHRGSRTFPGLLAAMALVATVLVPSVEAQAVPPIDFDSIDAYVRAEVEASALPGLSYAIVRDGEVIHVAAFGTADPTGRAMTTDTPVVIGSVGKTLTVNLKFGQNRERSIAGVRRISKPGLRVYAKSTGLPKVLGGLGVAIISTSQGLLTDRQANKKGVGGEVLAYVW